jgi:regulator of replication initiation timing
MERIKDLIKEYLLNTIQTKKNMRRRIYQLEEDLKEARANERYAVEQKEKYKISNQKLRRKIKGGK